jgi:HPr kinase/phosphorylase
VERLTAGDLLEKLREPLGLVAITESIESDVEITSPDVSRPGLLLAGFEAGFRPQLVQVLGEAELAYLDTLRGASLETALSRLCVPAVPCVIIADGCTVPRMLTDMGNTRGIPIVQTTVSAAELTAELAAQIEQSLAPQTVLHGTLVDVYGVGLLFTGESGIGKSECGLDLVENGHRLVADDVVHVVRTSHGHLIGSGSDLLKHHMEIRGVGIIDVRSIFGIRSIRRQKRIEVEVRLAKWSDMADYERLGIQKAKTEILGVSIPLVTLPLIIGKNITVISEVIALNHLLELDGIHPAKEFDRRLKDIMLERSRAADLARGDDE